MSEYVKHLIELAWVKKLRSLSVCKWSRPKEERGSRVVKARCLCECFYCSSVSDGLDASNLSCLSLALARLALGLHAACTPNSLVVDLQTDWPRNWFRSGAGRNCSCRGEDDGDNESVKGESLGEDHHEDKSDQDISLGVSTDTGITDDTNAETGSEGGKTTAEASTKGLVALIVVVLPLVGLAERSSGVRYLLHYIKHTNKKSN